MHPINSKYFGLGNIKVYFYDGSALTTGYIVKQIGTRRFIVSDGITTKTVFLTSNLAYAQRLDGTNALGTVSEITDRCTATMTVASVTKYIHKITDKVAITVDGAVYSWTLGTPSGTIYGLTKHVALVNTVLPAITGTAQTGQTLTTTNGTWTGSPSSYTRQWFADGVAISGATGTTYAVQAGTVGKKITTVVTAIRAGTSNATATSAQTATVIA